MSDPQPPISTYEPPSIPVYVQVPRSRQRYWLHALLLVLTFLSTLVVGSRMQFNFAHGVPAFNSDDDLFPIFWVAQQPARLLMGIPFSFTLMLILLCHELGHYVYCLRYRVAATLPFFIPAPTPIGTLGAFIRIKSPMRSRRALFDIGIAGPIAGFAVAIVVLALSLALSRPEAAGASQSELLLGYPLIFRVMHRLLMHGPAGYVPLERMLLHPTAIAAWVGMFATALNLLPGGQLDGGHIVYALVPRAHRWISMLTVVALVFMGGIGMWRGWLLWAVLLMLSGMRHPAIGPGYRPLLGFGTNGAQREAWAPLGRARVLLALFALAMLVLTFLPAPFPTVAAGPWRR